MSLSKSIAFEPLEGRRLLTFAAPAAGFGLDGYVAVTATNNPGQAVPLLDGRVIVTGDQNVTYLRGDGNLDVKRASNGRIGLTHLHANLRQVVVDRTTGRLAVLTLGDASDAETGQLTLRLYDGKGRLTATKSIGTPGDEASSVASLAFARDGTGAIFVATTRTTQSSSASSATLTLRRLDATLTPVASFGANGVIAVALNAGLERILPAADGSLTIVSTSTAFDQATSTSSTTLAARRFDAAGAIDADYAGPGQAVATLAISASGGTATHAFAIFGDADVDAAGTLYFTTTTGTETNGTESVTTGRLTRFAVGGAAQSLDIATPGGGGEVAIASPASVFVVTSPGRSQIYHLTVNGGGTMALDPSYSDFGAYTQTTAPVGGIATVDANGRLYLSGNSIGINRNGTTGVYAIEGGRDSIETVGSKSVALLGDGTLVVRGTSKADVIDVHANGRKVIATLDGRKTTFSGDDVRGVVIDAGNGDDRITTGASFGLPVYVLAGAGDDSVVGGPKGDTLVGASGNDTLIGLGGADDLYGQDGDDRIVGALHDGDRIYGGKGTDSIKSGYDLTPQSLASRIVDDTRVGDEIDRDRDDAFIRD